VSFHSGGNCFDRLLHNSFNPLYWLGLLIVWFLRLPFRLLGAAGFDAGKAEYSLWGKIFKVGLGLASFTAAVVVVADHLDDDTTVPWQVRCCLAPSMRFVKP
jgi:hypothetical protein